MRVTRLRHALAIAGVGAVIVALGCNDSPTWADMPAKLRCGEALSVYCADAKADCPPTTCALFEAGRAEREVSSDCGGLDVVMGKSSTPSTTYYFDHQTGSLVAVIVQEIVGTPVRSRPYVDYKSVCVGGPPEVLGFSDLPTCKGTRSCPFGDAGLPLTPSDAATD